MSTIEEVAALLAAARRVVLVPGYGVAVAQAQHALAHLAVSLDLRGVQVEFALHPVAGRVPGHLDALLDAAGVPWSARRDLDSATFDADSVALVVGANDVVNPALEMAVLEVARAGAVVVLIDTAGPGFAGVANPLFEAAVLLRGDAKDLLRETEEAIARIPSPATTTETDAASGSHAHTLAPARPGPHLSGSRCTPGQGVRYAQRND